MNISNVSCDEPAIPPRMQCTGSNTIIQSVQKLLGEKELAFQAFDAVSIPVEIFDSGGTVVFANRAILELYGVMDACLVVGKYNLLNDPVCNDRMGLREIIKKAFCGEPVTIPDFRPPIQELVDSGVIKEKPWESASMDVHLSPARDKDNRLFVVCVCIVKSIYRGKPELARAKEYISANWRSKFDPQTTAESLRMSVTQLYRLFKQHEGMTPGAFHKHCKIEHIKEKLNDKNLNIKEAFKACGEDSRGYIFHVFKEATGITPTQYRAKQITENR